MKKFIIATTFGLLFFLCTGCGVSPEQIEPFTTVDNPHDGLWQNADEVPFRFVLEQTWGVDEGPEEMMLNDTNRMGKLQIDDEGNIYILDWRASILSSFDADGRHRWSVGKSGDGPGEFIQAHSMVYDGSEYLLVFNKAGNRIDRFDLNGLYIDSHLSEPLYSNRLKGIGMLDATTLVASTPAMGILGITIVIISIEENWRLVTSYTVDQGQALDLPSATSYGAVVSILNGYILNNHVSDYLFEFRDTSGAIRSVVTRSMDKLVRPGISVNSGQTMIALFGGMNTPVKVTDDYYVAAGFWPADHIDPDERASRISDRSSTPARIEYESTLDLYNAQFELLYSWTTPEISHQDFKSIQGWDQAGKIYAIMNTDFPQIGRFRVEVTPPRNQSR